MTPKTTEPPPHPQLFPPPPPPPYPPPLHPDAGPQILALINNTNNNNDNAITNTNSTQTTSCGSSFNPAKKSRRVSGDYVPYDVDAAEREPQQLEITPITKYGLDPELVIGRQIAVNQHCICYVLKAGNVRILNLNTASRSLFRSQTKRGVGDKAVNQLERSVNLRLEATVGRQIQAQFQTSGKQALQNPLKSNLEASVIPACL